MRQPTEKSRLFVNLVGEVDPPLYLNGTSQQPRYVSPDYISPGGSAGWLKKLKRKILG
ncbi:hypothetical protein MESS2_1230005 [Mesorhizobium metallidurans STM 2683]|uniref:Uncharacterized protein n=1 Tax=Mesorhizobium metallidurans STM 2683 TaxID=1297569 RepID=M5EHV8_9HYPH|nr:hypothetical protein MESS2_1230005 [Mesorhizobium metallidurans STM 2683]